jgi:uncharacterized protein YjiS (DUF1127 family)
MTIRFAPVGFANAIVSLVVRFVRFGEKRAEGWRRLDELDRMSSRQLERFGLTKSDLFAQIA